MKFCIWFRKFFLFVSVKIWCIVIVFDFVWCIRLGVVLDFVWKDWFLIKVIKRLFIIYVFFCKVKIIKYCWFWLRKWSRWVVNCVLKMLLKCVIKFKLFVVYKSSSLCWMIVWKIWMCLVLYKKMVLFVFIFWWFVKVKCLVVVVIFWKF